MGKALEIFSKNLGALIETAKVSKATFCRSTGISRPSLDGYLKGEIDAQLSAVEKSAAFFGISVNEILSKDLTVKSTLEIKTPGNRAELAKIFSTLDEGKAADLLRYLELEKNVQRDMESERTQSKDKKGKKL